MRVFIFVPLIDGLDIRQALLPSTLRCKCGRTENMGRRIRDLRYIEEIYGNILPVVVNCSTGKGAKHGK